jgi:hypothetical protein
MILADSENGDKEAGKQKVKIKIDILSRGIYLLFKHGCIAQVHRTDHVMLKGKMVRIHREPAIAV